MSKQAKTAANLSGAIVVSVGILVWNEKEDDEGGSTTWVTKKDFKEAVQAAGGKIGAAVNSRTTVVVKGNTTRGDGYETPLKAIAEQQEQAGSRKAGALKVESLASFVKEYPALKEALQRRLSSAYWPKTISVYDKHAPGVDHRTGKPSPAVPWLTSPTRPTSPPSRAPRRSCKLRSCSRAGLGPPKSTKSRCLSRCPGHFCLRTHGTPVISRASGVGARTAAPAPRARAHQNMKTHLCGCVASEASCVCPCLRHCASVPGVVVSCDVSFFLVPPVQPLSTAYRELLLSVLRQGVRSKHSNVSVHHTDTRLHTARYLSQPRCQPANLGVRSLRLGPVESRLDHVRGRLVPVLTVLHDEAALWVARKGLVRVSSR